MSVFFFRYGGRDKAILGVGFSMEFLKGCAHASFHIFLFCYNWFWKSLKNASKKIATDKIPMNILHWSDLVQKLLHLKHSISQDCDIFESFPILTDQLPVNRLK